MDTINQQGERMMLVLTRRVGESILVFKDDELVMEIMMLGAQKGIGKVGITADLDYVILREEICEHMNQREETFNV